MNHDELCNRALAWLRGTRRCEPVFARCASCVEVPDAIGWSSAYHWEGCTVVECKTSRTDFYADKKKRFRWRHPDIHYLQYRSRRMSEREALAAGYIRQELPLMGNFRFYLSLPGIVTPELVKEHAPDHGLLWLKGRQIIKVVDAPRRTGHDHASEIRFLRFAIINHKMCYDNGKLVCPAALRAIELLPK